MEPRGGTEGGGAVARRSRRDHRSMRGHRSKASTGREEGDDDGCDRAGPEVRLAERDPEPWLRAGGAAHAGARDRRQHGDLLRRAGRPFRAAGLRRVRGAGRGMGEPPGRRHHVGRVAQLRGLAGAERELLGSVRLFRVVDHRSRRRDARRRPGRDRHVGHLAGAAPGAGRGPPHDRAGPRERRRARRRRESRLLAERARRSADRSASARRRLLPGACGRRDRRLGRLPDRDAALVAPGAECTVPGALLAQPSGGGAAGRGRSARAGGRRDR
jgi:hypothetical protein